MSFAVLAAGLLSISGYVLYLGFLSYNGYCFGQKRYLSNEEKILIVVREILARYPKQGNVAYRLTIEDGQRKWKPERLGPENPIPYRDEKEFFSINPGCCEVVKVARDTEGLINLPFLDRLFGFKSDFVVVRYFLRYRDVDGTEQKKLIQTAPVISSCGKTGDVFD
ncbi:hypothetical protein [Paucimonas lemoignei]|uniref:hypothetical protein n=1 Tax=Paucimonas lemoignei TaxID=29443 RepID=UPI0010467AF6|nr:hypothetical protein [Paucimonas lemoignei]